VHPEGARTAGRPLAGSHAQPQARKEKAVPKYVIERRVPGAGSLTPEQLEQLTVRSRCVVSELGPGIEWVESYVTDDTFYCIYVARSAELVLEHAARGGFPADRISEVRAVIGPKRTLARSAWADDHDGVGTN
jgi:hypothetical protein